MPHEAETYAHADYRPGKEALHMYNCGFPQQCANQAQELWALGKCLPIQCMIGPLLNLADTIG